MADAKQIIEINGKRYDAQTGKLLGQKSNSATPVSHAAATEGVALDGFVRPPRTQPKPPRDKKHLHNKLSRSPQKSKTLMRPAVKKPSIKAEKNQILHGDKPKLPEPHHQRLHRAKNTPKSNQVSRFGRKHVVPSQIVKKSAPMKVATPNRSAVQRTTEQFEQAIQEATSHLENFVPDSKSPRKRRFVFAGLTVVSVLVLGFLGWQMIPSAKVKYAGTRAGFSAQTPGYTPAGYGLNGNIQASSGEVTLSYDSRLDDKGFQIKQNPSNWTSQSLLTNFVIPTYGSNYQVYESGGKTIYINNNSNATWVDGGIWYRVEGNAPLTSDQLQRIVNSL